MITFILKFSRIYPPFVILLLVACSPKSVTPIEKPPLTAITTDGICEVQTNSTAWSSLLTNQPIYSGSRLRTGRSSFLDLASSTSGNRLALASESAVEIKRWTKIPNGNPNIDIEEVQLELKSGLLLVDLLQLAIASKFDVQGSNFVATVRELPTVAAINADGSVLVQMGTVVCVVISPANPPAGITLNAGQMLDPVARIAKPIPASSNKVWDLFIK